MGVFLPRQPVTDAAAVDLATFQADHLLWCTTASTDVVGYRPGARGRISGGSRLMRRRPFNGCQRARHNTRSSINTSRSATVTSTGLAPRGRRDSHWFIPF
jgi:hypothetical protein